ncbi:MAG: ABC transporter permease [Candidatus Wallbacteria bacterium]|nr:ABC transporter permease [Candidatus Wallbacteria bacterium]
MQDRLRSDSGRLHHAGLTTLIFSLLGGLILLFVVAPLLGMVLHCPAEDLAKAAADPAVTESIWLTLWTSMAATMIFAVSAVPLSYLLARKQFPLKGIVTGIIDLPVVIPHSAAGIALLGLISRGSLLGDLSDNLGFHFIGGPAGIMLAMAYVSLPFLINAARDGFSAVPERLEKAALNLGASPARVFFTISMPLAWRSILSGMILMFARGMSEFGAVVIVTYHPMITPVLIYERFGAFGLRYARPVSVIFVAVSLAVFVFLRFLGRKSVNAQSQ